MADFKREYVCIGDVVGYGPANKDLVVVSFSGKRGGTRSIEALDLKQARELRDKLAAALKKFSAR